MSEPFSFEGDEVTDFTAQLPSTKLEAPEAYPRGTIITLTVEVRVRSVRIEEDRKGNLSRNHVLTIEDCSIREVLTPAQRAELLAAAEEQALKAEREKEYTVTEEPTGDTAEPAAPEVDDQVTVEDITGPEDTSWATGSFPVGTEDPAPTDTNVRPFDFVAADQKRGLDVDDDDHSWMDDDDEGGVHVDRESLKAVVGF